jgi:hypothetical protein
MEIKGKVIQLLPLQSGMGKKGEWKKQEFILEVPGQYPKKVCLSCWGDKIDQFRLTAGDVVTVSVDLESREYNGRWFTEARAWKISKASNESAPIPTDEPDYTVASGTDDDMPF